MLFTEQEGEGRMVLIHPEYAYLILDLNDLKEEIADLIVERDLLLNYVCEELHVDYMLKIGALEYKLLMAGNEYKKNLRKLEIIEEKVSKKQKINVASIDKKVKAEFKEKTAFEQKFSKRIDLAIEATSLEMTDYDKIEEMNMDYFKLQKLYNPIFDLEYSEEKEKFYKKIEKYYEKYNYKKLHKLAEVYNDEDIFQDEISNLKILKDRYSAILKECQKQIRKIKNVFPYNQKTILEDENLCRRKKDALNKEIAKIQVENRKIEKKINNKLKKL